ncbi:alpha/beta hydrolase [Alkalihalobacillus alcalophilus ATCC 27647 = CGMCC 1.3604]|uniref:Alpha/beta hydrolase n=1 Tax=Alkalihalobacillus alcalophilus ATCC 27647 = CGMCC 1.3604 TaxID=1218173 RepID=A0A094WEE3_ALKAL|nr:alpha/beta hydrolase [Alkalihalobacillus alcalophilus]KGA96124.1 hypothetical protein BALCAV_0218210 [Alkalihalobacillus alcalophilus ATCC 27647 = CGMCC 1.3604]MED1564314.1 alpha/beta hydrolase [Alkalihalobacillus alcalophilus]THG92075.1 alpha/beta hydrolase [Alkalihalobacillus alcalophilus ATCC 27647 = CGMCC 1.3604]
MLLHTEFYGEGAPLLFLHSGAETSQTDYQNQKSYFMNAYQVIMPDLSGHGQSGIGDYNSIEELIHLTVEDLYQTLAHFNITKVHLVASSSSALIAIELCNRYPQLIKTLTMSGLTPIKTDDWDKLFNEDLQHKKAILTNPEADAYFKNLHVKSDWKKFVSLVLDENWYPFDLASDLSNLRDIPILIMSGEQIIPEIKGIVHYLDSYKHIHVAVIPFAGHLVHIDQPNMFNQVLELFLKQKAT